jgi:hypothetical protein
MWLPYKVADPRSVDVTTEGELSEVERHIRGQILPNPSLHNVSLIGYSKLSASGEVCG